MATTEGAPDEGVQQCIDLLEQTLGRPVILEDAMLRPIAYSRQPDDIDGARLNVILHRGVEPEFLRMCQGLGISTAQGPLWTPAKPEWDMKQRLCVPVRKGRALLAYLWILAPRGSLSEREIAAAVGTASVIAAALDARRKQRRSAEQNNQLMLAQLLGSRFEQDNLFAKLTTEENLPSNGRMLVMAFDAPAHRHGDGDAVDTALELKERLPGTWLPVRWMVHLGGSAAVFALPHADAHVAELKVAKAVHTTLSAYFGVPVMVGTGGGPVPLDQVRPTYDRAATAAWVARVSNAEGGVLSWSDIGSWRLLARLAGGRALDHPLEDDLHPGLLRLLRDGRADLVDTLEVYLETGGDARATAEALYLHRSTLYYRIERIAEITGANLRDGETRFELMLGLRLATLRGFRQAPQKESPQKELRQASE